MVRRLRDDASAAGQMVGFLVAVAIFVGAIGTILVTTRDTPRVLAGIQLDQDSGGVAAQALADRVVGTGGTTGAGADWAAAPDTMERFGLRDANDPALLSAAKLANLRRAPLDANATDGLVNYPEARNSLDLDSAGLDFHIRTWPDTSGLRRALDKGQRLDIGLRVAYVAHMQGSAPATGSAVTAPTITAPTCKATSLAGVAHETIATTVLNNGVNTTQFWGSFQVLAANGTLLVAATGNTAPVAPGATATLGITVPAEQIHCLAAARILVSVYDPVRRLADAEATLFSTVARAGTTPPYGLAVESYAASYAMVGQHPAITVAAPGTSKHNKAVVGIKVVNATGVTVYDDSTGLKFSTPGAAQYDRIPATLAAGAYTVVAYGHDSGKSVVLAQSTMTLVVTANAIGPYVAPSAPAAVPIAGSAAINESAILAASFRGFCPFYVDNAAASPITPTPLRSLCATFSAPGNGSVYPDFTTQLTALPAALAVQPDPLSPGALRPAYTDVLVIGSDVDQSVLSKPSTTIALRNWTWAGGQLVVLGSAQQAVGWLEPMFAAATTSSSGGLTTPDIDHPLLHTPYDLHMDHYAAPLQAWRLSDSALDHFTVVILDSAGNHVLAASDPGSLGLGRVVLVAWEPANLLGTPGAAQTTEAQHLLANIILTGMQDLYVDYGPAIPDATPVEPAVRIVPLIDPRLGLVQMTVAVYVFPHVA